MFSIHKVQPFVVHSAVHLFCRGQSQERRTAAEPDRRSSTPLSHLQQERPSTNNNGPFGVDLTPSVLRNVLKEASEIMDELNVAAASAEGDETAPKGNSSTAETEVESEAVLWAMHNFWFGVEEDMTEAAYQVRNKDSAHDIRGVHRVNITLFRFMMSCNRKVLVPLQSTTVASLRKSASCFQ